MSKFSITNIITEFTTGGKSVIKKRRPSGTPSELKASAGGLSIVIQVMRSMKIHKKEATCAVRTLEIMVPIRNASETVAPQYKT